MKKYKVLLAIICIVIVGIISGCLIYYLKNNQEPIVYIENAEFTLNDIRNRFLETDYAKENSCKGQVSENKIHLKCQDSYDFVLDGTTLTLQLAESANKEVFKYMVDVIQTFYGNEMGDYYESMDMFLNKEFFPSNLFYRISDDFVTLSLDLTEKLKTYEKKDAVTTEDIISINKTDFIFENNDYTIDNIEFLYNPDINWITFGGMLYGEDHNVILKLQFYNQANELIYEVEDDLSLLQDFGYPFYGFVVNVNLNDINIDYQSISGYNIELNKVV